MFASLSSALVTEHSQDHWKLPGATSAETNIADHIVPTQSLPLWQEFTKPSSISSPIQLHLPRVPSYLPGSACLTEHEAEPQV